MLKRYVLATYGICCLGSTTCIRSTNTTSTRHNRLDCNNGVAFPATRSQPPCGFYSCCWSCILLSAASQLRINNHVAARAIVDGCMPHRAAHILLYVVTLLHQVSSPFHSPTLALPLVLVFTAFVMLDAYRFCTLCVCNYCCCFCTSIALLTWLLTQRKAKVLLLLLLQPAFV